MVEDVSEGLAERGVILYKQDSLHILPSAGPPAEPLARTIYRLCRGGRRLSQVFESSPPVRTANPTRRKTLVPTPSLPSTSSLPPSPSTRSRMPVSPIP